MKYVIIIIFLYNQSFKLLKIKIPRITICVRWGSCWVVVTGDEGKAYLNGKKERRSCHRKPLCDYA